MPRVISAITTPKAASGTTAMTAAGLVQLSYCAASTKKTNTTANRKIRYWPPEMLAAYQKAWDEVVEEESKKNANFKKVYASYSKFREEFKLWGDNGYLKR